jgi:hypothetical protein
MLLVRAASATEFDFEPEPAVSPARVDVQLNMTAVAYHAGECAVGLTCGATAAWVVRKLQSTLVTMAVLGGIGTAAALHVKWVSLDQVRLVLSAIARMARQKAAELMRQADINDDGEVNMEDSHIMYSRIAPVAQRHVAFTGGLAGGLVAGLSQIR